MNRLKELRKQKNLTQSQFGKIFGASQNTVSNWENGNRKIGTNRLIRFAEFFGVSIEYILGQDVPSDKKAPPPNDENIDQELVSLLSKLPKSDIQRVKGFVQGLLSVHSDSDTDTIQR